MNNIDTTPVLNYYQVDWSKPPPPLDSMVKWTRLTEEEAGNKNYALAANGTTLRWIKADGQNADVE